MWRIAYWTLGLAGCGFHGLAGAPNGSVDARSGGDAASGDWLPGYQHRKAITITPGDVALADFPVGLVVDDPQVTAGAHGRDLVVTADDGITVLSSELEALDATTGSIVLWFRVPALANPTHAVLYYGGPAVAPDPATWTPLFAGVWHLGDATPGSTYDSTAHGLTMTQAIATKIPSVAAGRAYTGRLYNGAGASLSTPDEPSLDMGTSSFSYSVWVYVDQSVGPYDIALDKGGASATDAGYDLELGTGGWSAYIGDGTVNRGVTFGSESAFLHRWVYLTIVADRTAHVLRPYADGVEKTALDISGLGAIDSPGHRLSLGRPDNYFFNGRLDEARVYRDALTADWIATEYGNLANPGGFIALGNEETR